MTSSSTNTFCILCITFLFATFHDAISTSTPAATLTPCASYPCENGGTCMEYTAAYQCRCTNDYTGLRCEIPVSTTASLCDDNPCAHGACVSSASDRFTCMCPGEWRGTACEIDVNECSGERGPNPCVNDTVCINEDGGYRCEDPCASPSPCNNGGTCFTTDTKPYYTCECTARYEGETCDIVVETPCVKDPCQHGATCTNNQSAPLGFQCECSEDYQGILCENMIPPCSKDPCLNGGSCQSDITSTMGYMCLCDQGFEGNNCEVAVISPCTSQPCENGGSCQPRVGALTEFSCICQQGYRGTLCEIVLHAVCTFQGVTYQEGSERKEDCNMCHCQQGSWHCTDKFCGEFMVSFAFINANSFENDDDDENFSNTLKDDIAEYFDINVNMIQVLTVSGNPAEVQFQLQDTLDSEVDIENVAADMLRQFVTGTYAFHYNQASYSINSRTVVIERRDLNNEANDLTHNGDGQRFISTTLLIVCVVVSTILVFAVLFGIAMIVVYKRRSRKEQIYCRKDKNTNASNNVAGGAIKYHKNVYNPVPPCPPSRDVPVEVAEIRLQNGAGKPDVNINMEARV